MGISQNISGLKRDGPHLAIALKVLTRRLLRRGARYGEREYLAQRPNIRASNMVADAYFLFLQREQCDCMPKNHLDSLIPNNPLSIRHPNT